MVGATVVVGAAVVAGAEDAAWAGVITESTIGLDHLLGSITTVATPPIMTVFMTCRRLIFLFSSITQKFPNKLKEYFLDGKFLPLELLSFKRMLPQGDCA